MSVTAGSWREMYENRAADIRLYIKTKFWHLDLRPLWIATKSLQIINTSVFLPSGKKISTLCNLEVYVWGVSGKMELIRKPLQDYRWKWGYEIKIKTFITIICFQQASSSWLVLSIWYCDEGRKKSNVIDWITSIRQCLHISHHPQTVREISIYFVPRTSHWTAASSPVEHNISTKRLSHTFATFLFFAIISPRELSQPHISMHVTGSVFMLTYLCCLIDRDKLNMIPWSRWKVSKRIRWYIAGCGVSR